jgi:glycosyltransferase involved in cell wall biosynthesis
LLPTLTDTLSTQIQEALASGIPCICSNVDGNPEMIQHGKNGLLFDPCDPITVKEQIREFVENQELRHRLRLNAKPLWDSNLVAEKFLMHV